MQTGVPEEEDGGPSLFDPQQLSTLGRQVKRLNEWAEETKTGDRDELVPGVSEQAWRQVAVTAKECLGAQRRPQGTECFAELARAEAARRTSWSRTTRCWPSTLWRSSRSCPSTTW